ncbi:DUF2125 domain-containing protein [Falsirhodobacter sp. 20TX0035]|uniref:DUF2125 domain-containing protein n=1 Tax=Falsirhodobacter sp. 20TX0035 TaxID=3022019 RepID=UPI00232BF454|nr:DUF2125 domain-containing protein [Falsirhodobacter sp. 20TX0035]MDB6453817.1 DUF2125 domain-containing protein [Falsirhodobacter sp. 20TX0035]
MRALVTLLIVLAAAFSGYWFLGAHYFRQGVENWFAAQGEAGRSAEVQGLEIGGFPTAFRATSDTIVIADPSGWGWQTPSADVSMPSWWPFRITARLPEHQVVDTPRGQWDVTVQDLVGRFGLSPSLAPDTLHVDSGALQATGADGTLRLGNLRFDSARGEGFTHHVTLTAEGLGLEGGPVNLSGGSLAVEGDITFAERIDDLPDAVAVPIDRLSLAKAELRLADAAVTATGDLVSDGRGFAAGELTLRLENWQAALDAAVAAGLIPANRVDMLEGGFRMMAEDGVLELPLTLSGGDIRFGPLPLGPAPRFR